MFATDIWSLLDFVEFISVWGIFRFKLVFLPIQFSTCCFIDTLKLTNLATQNPRHIFITFLPINAAVIASRYLLDHDADPRSGSTFGDAQGATALWQDARQALAAWLHHRSPVNVRLQQYMEVSKNGDTPSNHPFIDGFAIRQKHLFWGPNLFWGHGNPHILLQPPRKICKWWWVPQNGGYKRLSVERKSHGRFSTMDPY